MIPFARQNVYMSLWIEGGGSSALQNTKKWGFTCSITHPASTRMFGQKHASFFDENVHSSSSVLYSCTRKIIGNSEWWKMAGPRDQLTLEAGLTVFPRCWNPVELYPYNGHNLVIQTPFELHDLPKQPQWKVVSLSDQLHQLWQNFGGQKWLAKLCFGWFNRWRVLS